MTRLIRLARALFLSLGIMLVVLSLSNGAPENAVAQPNPDYPSADLPDLVVSAPNPDNGASSPPFCVGQAVDWHTTVTNQGAGDADSTYLGYYIGTNVSDFGNRVDSDATGVLAPNGGSSAEHEIHTFSAADAGVSYANVWVDYAGDLEEEDENNNRNSYGPFEVLPLPTPPPLVAPSDGAGTCDPSPTFSWGNIAGATSYHIQVNGSPDFSSPDIDETTLSTSYTPATALGPGTAYWRVGASNACGDGAWSAVWSFTVQTTPGAPGLISPADGSIVHNAAPTFVWGSVSGANVYRIQVAEDSGFTSLVINETTSGITFSPANALADDTTYHWRVGASNACESGAWSPAWQFTVDAGCPTPPAPALVSPADGSSTCDPTPTLMWGAASGATSYRIQVDDDPGLSSPVIDVTTSSTSHTPGTALSPGTYYWRAQPSNTCGAGAWSSVWSFTVLSVPGYPGLVSPTNGSVVAENTPTFSWSTVSGAASYRIQVADNVGFTSPTVDVTTSDTAHIPASGLADGTTYYWRVRASNACGDGSWSTVWSFTVDMSCPTPSQPSLFSPADGSATCEAVPTFSWYAVTGATSYRIQMDDAPGFSSPEINQVTINPSYTAALSLPPGSYDWRVQASNVCGAGSWSLAWRFFILSAPTPPSLMWPPNGGSGDDPTPLLEWSAVAEATSYRVQVDDHASFSVPEIDETTSGTWHTSSTPLAPDTYYWRVHASNACGAGLWSSPAWTFTITTEPDTTPPAAITDLTTATGRLPGAIDLSWTAPGDDGALGRAATYVVRYNSTLITEDVWEASTDVTGEPAPGPPASRESLTVSGLVPGQRYFFAIKTRDNVPNTSGISNSPHAVSGSPFLLYLPVVFQMRGVWVAPPVRSAE